MSIHRWLAASSGGARSPYLPHAERRSSTEAANKEVACVLEQCDKRKRARSEYHHYTAETRAKIAKYACENGNKAAVNKYSMELGHSIAEGTVRNFKRRYLEQLKSVRDPDLIISLPNATLGRPLLIGKFDDEVAQYIRNLRLSGGIVNSNIVIAAAKGIIGHKSPSFLRDYGGSLRNYRSSDECMNAKKWAESFLLRRGYVKRKATKAARKLPTDFPELKLAYLKRIQEEVKSNAIPLQLLFN